MRPLRKAASPQTKVDIQSWHHGGGVKDVKKLVKDVCGALWTVKLTSLESRQRL